MTPQGWDNCCSCHCGGHRQHCWSPNSVPTKLGSPPTCEPSNPTSRHYGFSTWYENTHRTTNWAYLCSGNTDRLACSSNETLLHQKSEAHFPQECIHQEPRILLVLSHALPALCLVKLCRVSVSFCPFFAVLIFTNKCIEQLN